MSSGEGKYPTKCPYCGSTEIMFDSTRREYICRKCGAVLAVENIDHGQEWRTFDMEEVLTKGRGGMPMDDIFLDASLVTVIDSYDTSKISHENRARVNRLRRLQAQAGIYNSLERNINQATKYLKSVAEQLELPPVIVEETKRIYRKAAEHGFTRGKNIKALVVAAIYLSFRKHNMIQPLDALIDHFKEELKRNPNFRKDVSWCVRMMQMRLGLGIKYASAEKYIPVIADKLRLGAEVRTLAMDILQKAKEKGITIGKDPSGLAAAALYIASVMYDRRKTQQQIARAARVTEVTIRNRYKQLVRELKLDIPA